jgi:hypothetical protein
MWSQLYSLAETPPPATLPRIWARIRGRYWSAKIGDISLWPPGCNFFYNNLRILRNLPILVCFASLFSKCNRHTNHLHIFALYNKNLQSWKYLFMQLTYPVILMTHSAAPFCVYNVAPIHIITIILYVHCTVYRTRPPRLVCPDSEGVSIAESFKTFRNRRYKNKKGTSHVVWFFLLHENEQ